MLGRVDQSQPKVQLWCKQPASSLQVRTLRDSQLLDEANIGWDTLTKVSHWRPLECMHVPMAVQAVLAPAASCSVSVHGVVAMVVVLMVSVAVCRVRPIASYAWSRSSRHTAQAPPSN